MTTSFEWIVPVCLIVLVAIPMLILLTYALPKRQAEDAESLAKHGVPRQSPLQAGLLNFIPGLGFLWLGEPKLALRSFLTFAALTAIALGLRIWVIKFNVIQALLTMCAVSAISADQWARQAWLAGRNSARHSNEAH